MFEHENEETSTSRLDWDSSVEFSDRLSLEGGVLVIREDSKEDGDSKGKGTQGKTEN